MNIFEIKDEFEVVVSKAKLPGLSLNLDLGPEDCASRREDVEDVRVNSLK